MTSASRTNAPGTLVLFCAFACLVFSVGADYAQGQETWRNPKDGMVLVRVPAGSFRVIVPVGELSSGSNVLQTVTFSESFWLGRTEVTVAQFRKFVKATGYRTEAERAGGSLTWRAPGFPQGPDHPVVFLNHKDALNYTLWAGVDLPSEAEWLYACKAGSTNRFYWGEKLDDRYAWHRQNTRATGTRPVGHKLPNAWGLYDMVGNAWEYCRVGESCWTSRGSSWTRANSYLTRQGFVAEDLVAEGVEMRLQRADPNPPYPPYPWDDDKGFRCIRRSSGNR